MCFREVFPGNLLSWILDAHVKFFSSLYLNRTSFQQCSSLKKLAEKGCWDIAEIRTNSDRQLVEYLVRSGIVIS